MEQCELLDVGKYKSRGRCLQFTHFPAASLARLDRAYTSVCLASYVNHYNVKPVSFTDHCLVTVPLGNGFANVKTFDWQLWKLYVRLSSDVHFY